MKSRAVCCYCESISGENISGEIDRYIVYTRTLYIHWQTNKACTSVCCGRTFQEETYTKEEIKEHNCSECCKTEKEHNRSEYG